MESIVNHAWMLAVLSDLEEYSRSNNLTAVQEKVALARETMQFELEIELEGQLVDKELKTWTGK